MGTGWGGGDDGVGTARSAAGGARLYNLRLPPKASGKDTGPVAGARSGVIAPVSSTHSFPKPFQPDQATPRFQPDHATPRSGVIAPVSPQHLFPKPFQPDHATPRSGVIARPSS